MLELALIVCCTTQMALFTDVEDGATLWEMKVLVSICVNVCSCDLCLQVQYDHSSISLCSKDEDRNICHVS